MPFALDSVVDIELLIEGNRDALFQKIAYPDLSSYPISDSSERSSNTVGIPSIQQSYLQADESPYDVQDSCLSNDKSERIFKVKHLGFIHYYFAFKFNGYVILPAFLATKFKVSDYACLDISNGFHHYYIFLNGEIDDPLSVILGESSLFFGGHYSQLPLPLIENALTLNPGNKDIEYFIGNYSLLFNDPEFRLELCALSEMIHLNYCED